MFKNYLKIALRHISRNKTYVFVNVVGLGIALACMMITFANWQLGQTADKNHENYAEIYQLVAQGVGFSEMTADVVAPLAKQAANDISGIKAGVRFSRRGVTIKNGDDVFREVLKFVDPNFLEVFSFPLVTGDAADIKDPSKIFISEEKAKKYFGTESPLGKTLIVNVGEPNEKAFTIGGVVAEAPINSSIKFDFLTNIAFLEYGPNPANLGSWDLSMDASFVLLDKTADKVAVEKQLDKFVAIRNKASQWGERTKYLLQPMSLFYLKSNEINNNRLNSVPHEALFWMPAMMAFMILLTTCLNFTITTISFSNKRLKEMGLRKVMGGARRQLITQLLGEATVICLLALILGMVIAEYLLPIYNNMWGFLGIEVALDYFQNKPLSLFLIAIMVFTAILGGAYPAFYVSSFKPTTIFRGSTKFGGDNWLIRSLLGLQIVISLITVVGAISFSQNANFHKNYDLGYDYKSVINVSLEGELAFNKFKNAITENPHVLAVAGAKNNLGFSHWTTNLGKPEDNRDVQMHLIGDNFLEVMDLALLSGRDFDNNLETDYSESVLITEKLMKEEQWTPSSAIGQTIDTYNTKKKVIGVVEDFYPHNFFQKPNPSVFHFQKPNQYRVMKVKVAPEHLIATNQFLKEQWSKSFPLVPFESYYQDKSLADALRITGGGAKLYLFLAIIAIFLSTTGLYALVAMNFQKRAKEIAIRRVLGAGVENISYILNKNYMLIFIIGGVLGAYIGVTLSQFALGLAFEVFLDVDKLSATLAVVGVCLLGAGTIGSKLFDVLRTNPADTLKSE